MNINGTHYKTVWMEGTTVKMINQVDLPFSFSITECADYKKTAECIRNMTIRGAGAIGSAAAYAMAQAINDCDENEIDNARQFIEATRPTARNLFAATEFVFDMYVTHGKKIVFSAAEQFAANDEIACLKIGEIGEALLTDGMRVLTHCNAGWLAFTDYGSALSPIYTALSKGKNVFVYVSETRPRNQGAKLTAFELHQQGVKHAIVPDSAGAYIMSMGLVDVVIVGADRIAMNGDVANKIGTLDKAVAAKHFGIPFYVAAPLATFDQDCLSGDKIVIEQRSCDELFYAESVFVSGENVKVPMANVQSSGLNYGFDVTPCNLIDGIITEKGILKPYLVHDFFKDKMSHNG